MTYDGIFEKCEDLMELRLKYKEMKGRYNDPISRMDQDRAYKKRREEIRNKWKEHNYA